VTEWGAVQAQAPEFAERVRAAFDAHRHKTLATLRRDGSPRISGTEAYFRDGGVWFGSMYRAVKALDLLRDGRFALHSAPVDVSHAMVDAKIAGHAVEVHDPEVKARYIPAEVPGPSHLFRADLTEAVLVSIGDPPDHLVIESWHPGRGYERRTVS
jgi:hypothetical protein